MGQRWSPLMILVSVLFSVLSGLRVLSALVFFRTLNTSPFKIGKMSSTFIANYYQLLI